MAIDTIQQYDAVMQECFSIYRKKIKDYGTSWRILRPASITDQIFIKAQRIRTVEETGKNIVGESIDDALMGIVNYAIIGLIQLELLAEAKEQLSETVAHEFYQKYQQEIRSLMIAKNQDYGEAWRDMRMQSFTDLILMKLLRIKQIEENDGSTLISEGISGHYMDIVNYAIFALIKIKESK